MKKSIILISALSMLGLMLVSCSSAPETTTTTTRQTTVTAPPTTQGIPPPRGGVQGADPVEIGRH